MPASTSIQHAGLATAMTSAGAAAGFFAGALDEARIWSVARSQSQIVAAMGLELAAPQTGMIARWALNEGAGSVAGNCVSGGPAGTLTASPLWTSGAPVTAAAPGPPLALDALAAGATSVHLSWTDGACDETGFSIERSTTGAGGPWSVIGTASANAVAYDDNSVSGGLEYCYQVRALNGAAASSYTDVACATTSAETCRALDLTGADAYVDFGNPPALQLSQFTIEMWFRRDGAGVGTNTGTNGIPDLIPMLAKGRAEVEDPTKDINYMFGIRASDGVLAADFEQAGGDTASLNHPVAGVTPVSLGQWHHGAVTYDGQTWKLYLDGALDRSFTLSNVYFPASGTLVSAALGSALTSTGVAAGFFDGVVDEVRVWNVARSAAQIQGAINQEITTAQAGLVARWSLNETSGTAVVSSAGTTANGTIVGAGYSHSAQCAPFNWGPPTAPSALAASAPGGTTVHLSWTDNASNEASFEIERSTAGAGGPFSPLTSVAANAVAYDDNSVSPNQEYCYRVRAVNGAGNSAYVGPQCATTSLASHTSLDLTPDTYVSFGDPAALDLPQFTIECWFRRDGAGVTTTTGTGGVTDAIPLVTKGRGESEASNVDLNWFLGIRAADGVLCADFEEGAGGASPSLNHPVIGVTAAAGRRRLAPRRGCVRRLHVESVPGRQPRSDAGGRPAGGIRQYAAGRDRQRVDLDQRRGRVLRWRGGRSAGVELGAVPERDPRRGECPAHLAGERYGGALESRRRFGHERRRRRRHFHQRQHHGLRLRVVHAGAVQPGVQFAAFGTRPDRARERRHRRAGLGRDAERRRRRPGWRQCHGVVLRPPAKRGGGPRLHAGRAPRHAVLHRRAERRQQRDSQVADQLDPREPGQPQHSVRGAARRLHRARRQRRQPDRVDACRLGVHRHRGRPSPDAGGHSVRHLRRQPRPVADRRPQRHHDVLQPVLRHLALPGSRLLRRPLRHQQQQLVRPVQRRRHGLRGAELRIQSRAQRGGARLGRSGPDHLRESTRHRRQPLDREYRKSREFQRARPGDLRRAQVTSQPVHDAVRARFDRGPTAGHVCRAHGLFDAVRLPEPREWRQRLAALSGVLAREQRHPRAHLFAVARTSTRPMPTRAASSRSSTTCRARDRATS